MKTLQEILKRKAELRSLLQGGKCENLDEVETEIRELDQAQADIEKRNSIIEQLGKGVSIIQKPEERSFEIADEDIVSSREYRCAYFKTLQKKELTETEQRALTTASSSAGAVVPTQTMNKIIEKMKTTGKMLPLITQMRIPSNVEMPIEGTINDASWVSEGTASKDSEDKLDNLSLSAFKLIKTISITAEVSAMSIDAFEDFIVGMLMKKVEKALEYSILNGNGTTQAKGIITTLTGTENAIETVMADVISYDDLQDLDALLPEGYEDNAYYIMNKKTLRKRISKIKDDNKQPIYKKETDEKTKKVVDGYPVVLTANMPDDVILLGDPSAYFLNIVKDFVVAKDGSVGFRSGDEVFRILGLVDGKLSLGEAFVMLTVKEA